MVTNSIFKFLMLTPLTSVLLFSFIEAANSQSVNEVRIAKPNANAEVRGTVIAEGTVKINDESHLWILVRPTPDNNPDCNYTTEDWYPQRQPRVKDGKWKATVVIGHGQKDIGCKYEIAAATFGKKSENEIVEYFKEGDESDAWNPISFPDKTSNISIVIVKKMH